jgi:hypothetical protein
VSANDFPRHHSSELQVAAAPEVLFAALDDHRRLASHMERPSLMTFGGSMQTTTDALLGKAVGSAIHMSGTVLGLRLALDEVVTQYKPPFSKVWETRGEPRLLVISNYRMGFTISPSPVGSLLAVFIDYRRPGYGLPRILGWCFGRAYAAWCTRRMAKDAVLLSGLEV